MISENLLGIYLFINAVLTYFNFVMLWKIIFILDSQIGRTKSVEKRK